MKICIWRSGGGLGDILFLTPVIKELHNEGYSVDVGVDRLVRNDIYYKVLENNPYINKVIHYKEIKIEDYTKCVNLSNVAYAYEMGGFDLTRPEIFGRYCGVNIKSNKPEIFIKRLKKQDVISLHFKGAEKRRSLSKNISLKIIQLLLLKTKSKILLLNNIIEIKNERIKQIEEMEISKAIEEVSQSKLFIGVDSAWLHICAALDIETVSIFGSTKPNMRVKDYRHNKSVFSSSSCRGCFYKECEEDYKCMKTFDEEELYSLIHLKIEKSSA